MDQETKLVVRLSPEEFNILESKFPPQVVTAETSQQQAGFFLGIQHVLSIVRKGWVVGQ